MKREDVLYTNRIYQMVVEDFIAGDPEAIVGVVDCLVSDKGYKFERLVSFFADTYPLVKKRIERKQKAKGSRIITLVNEVFIH